MTAHARSAHARDDAPPAPGGYAYFDHDADVGVVGRGGTPEEAMAAAARATGM